MVGCGNSAIKRLFYSEIKYNIIFIIKFHSVSGVGSPQWERRTETNCSQRSCTEFNDPIDLSALLYSTLHQIALLLDLDSLYNSLLSAAL